MRHIFIYICIFLPSLSFAQLGGATVYEFVNTPSSARDNALGGKIISLDDGDIALAMKNPSLLDSTYSGEFSSTWASYHMSSTNIGLGSFNYAHSFNKLHCMAGIHFFNYGRFYGYDEDGTFAGTFFASDYEIVLGAAYEVYPKIFVGGSLKPILSYYETYSSIGLLGDIAVSYKDTANQLTSSIVLSNIGWQLKPYTVDNNEPMPYSLDIGISKKLAHAPFRFNFTYEGLHNFDLQYSSILSEQNTLINQEVKEEKFNDFANTLLKHVHIGAEILLIKNFEIDLGYNFRKANELSYGDSKKGVGLSFGFNLKTSYFALNYGWSKQHTAGGLNYFTFSTNVDKLYTQFTK